MNFADYYLNAFRYHKIWLIEMDVAAFNVFTFDFWPSSEKIIISHFSTYRAVVIF